MECQNLSAQEVPSKQLEVLHSVEYEDKRTAQEPWQQSGLHPCSQRLQQLCR